MDDPAPLLHVDWQRWLQNLANAIQAPLTAGMIPDIPFTKIAMTLSPRLLGRTTAGAGAAEQITVSAPLTLAAGALGLSTPLLAIYGGTGFASYAVGDLLYADTTTTLAKLADVSAGSYLRSGGVGVAPLWSTAKLPNTATTGDVLYASAANVYSNLADVAAGSYLRSGGVTTAPLWSTLVLPNAAVTGDLLYASSANTLTTRVIGSTADVLTVTGGVPVWAPPAAAATVTITNDVTTNATMFPTWVTANTGNLPIKVSSTLLTWNPSTALFNVIGTIQADTLVQVGTGAGSSGGNTNLIRPTAASAFLNIKGGSGKAKMVIANELLTFISGNSSGAVEFNFGATASTNVGTRGMRFSTLGGFGLGNTFSGNEPGNGNMQIEGTLGAGVSTVTAVLHLKAGTIAASTAPLKFNSGPLLTTAEAGAVEFLTDDFYATITTGAARKGIVLNDGTALTSGRVPFATTNGRLTDSANLAFISPALTIGVAGITRGEVDFAGNTSGVLVLRGPSTASGTLTLPAGTTDFSATGGTSQVVKQTSAGGAFTVGTVSASDIATGFTLGSVVFAGTSGVLSQDNAHFFWDDTNNRLGIGTASPGFILEMESANPIAAFDLTDTTLYSSFRFLESGSTAGSLQMIGSAFATSTRRNNLELTNNSGGNGTITLIPNINAQPVLTVINKHVGIGNGVAFPGTGTDGLVFIDGTALASMASNTAGLFADDVSGTVHMFAISEAGITMQLTGAANNTLAVAVQDLIVQLGKVTKYNAVTTAGWGVPAIYGSGRSTGQTAAVASVAAYTVPATDGSFEVSANVLVTTATTHNFTVAVDYTDEGNTARTLTLNFSQVAGTLATAITNVTGAGPYEGVPLHIRCKASTAITVKTVGTFTTVTYNVEGSIRQIA